MNAQPMKKRMFGLVIPTITPLTVDGKVDEVSTACLCEYLALHGANCVYPNGTNGESLLLTKEERQRIAEIMVTTNQNRMSAFIQCGSMTTAETVEHALHSVSIGADGIGVMSPAFFPMDEEALFRYYRDVLTKLPSDYPVYIYNIPSCTTNDVTPRLLRRLLDAFPNIAGIKFSSGDLMRIEDYLMQAGRDIDLLIGCDSLFYQCLATGGVGTVSGPGTVFIERFTRLYQKYQEGDYAAAAEIQKKIVATDRIITKMPGIPALKALLKMRKVIATDVCRAPNRALTSEEYAILERVYEEYCEEENIRD